MLEIKRVRTPDGREEAIDVIKVIAIYFVMVIHVSAASLYTFSNSWLPTIIIDSVARPAVPLFFMVTGALLLPRQHSVPSIVQRVRRVAVPLIFWSFVYLIYAEGMEHASAQWIVRIISGPAMYHLWYLYSLIGLYVFMPVFSGFYQTASDRVIVFCLVVWFFGFTVYPALNEITGFGIGVPLGFNLFGGYLVLGAFANDKRCSAWLNTRAVIPGLVAIWLVSVMLTACFTYAWATSSKEMKETFFTAGSPTVAIGTLAIFLLVGRMQNRLEQMGTASRKVLNYLSRTSFGVYLMHVLLLQIIQYRGINSTTPTPWIAIPLISLFLLVACSILVWMMQSIPYVRRVVT